MRRYCIPTLIRSLGVVCCLCCSRSNGVVAYDAHAGKADATDTLAGATSEQETLAIVVVDEEGAARTACPSNRKQERALFPGAKLAKILDMSASGRDPALVAVTVSNSARLDRGETLLLRFGQEPRPLGAEVRWASFSPQGDAVLVESETRQHVGGGVVASLSTSAMVETSTGKAESLGALSDPRWEPDGQHVRGTLWRKSLRDRKTHVTADWLGTRVRWDRVSKVVTELGPGSAQLPAPRGRAVVWSGEPLRSALNDRCTLSLEDGEKVHPLPAAGRVCQGSADARWTRWSNDGRWLAFTGLCGADRSPSHVQSSVLEVVSSSGLPHPALAGLLAAMRMPRVAPSTASPSECFPWMDWSAMNDRLVVQDSGGMVTLYDLAESRSLTLGVWRAPQLSPRGQYVLVRAFDPSAPNDAPFSAFVISSKPGSQTVALGRVRDARWGDARVCMNEKGP